MRKPPKVASALLKRISDNDALAGDLRERYLAGRSSWWYWRQVLTAILVGQPRYGVLLLRGVVAGWLLLATFHRIETPLSRVAMGRWALDWLIVHLGSHPFVMLWATQLWWRPLRAVGYLTCGWIVARTHSKAADIVLVILMASELISAALDTVQYIAHSHQAYGTVAYPNWEIAFTMLPFLILVGGSFGGSRTGAQVKIAA